MTQQKIIFKINSECELPMDFINAIPRSGAADDSVDWLIKNYDVECPEVDAITYLERVGAWDSNELKDHEANLGRLIWIACLECQENKSKYWYMGE